MPRRPLVPAALLLATALFPPAALHAQVQTPTAAPAPTAVAPARGAAFLEQVTAHFADWDRDHDGTLAKAELDAAVADTRVTGPQAAAVAALKRSTRSKKYPAPTLTATSIRELAVMPAAPDRPDFAGMYAAALAKIKKAGGGALFAGGAPKLESVRQGRLGNCFCLAPLGALLARNPQEVAGWFRRQPDGAYQVTLGKETVSVATPTDAEVAMGGSADKGEMWLNLYEKAVGQTRARNASTAPLDAISRGGSAGTVLSLLTGHKIERFSCRFAKDAKTTPEEREAKLKDLRGRLTAAMTEKRLVTCGTVKPTTPGITPNHAYAVLGYDAATDTLRLWNPHGNGFKPKGPAGPQNGYPMTGGVFSLPLPEFVDQFSGLAFELTDAPPEKS